jgi:hypothetical protein
LRGCAECAFFGRGTLVANGLNEDEIREAVSNCTSGQEGDVCPYKFWEERVEEIPNEWPNCTFKIGR